MKLSNNKAVLMFIWCFLIGCTQIPKDYGKSDVDELLAERKVPEQDITKGEMDAYFTNVLNKPLTIEDVTKLALYKNNSIQKSYAKLGFSAANLYKAGRIDNPVVTFTQLYSSDSNFRDLTNYSFGFSLSDLFKMPSNIKTAEKNFEAAKQEAAADILNAIRNVQVAYYEYVATKQITRANKEFHTALTASAEFDRNDYDFGLLTDRELLELNVVIAEAKFNAIQANNKELEARTKFANLLNLEIDDDWDIFDTVTIPIDNELNLTKLTETAKEASLELAAQRTKIKELEKEVEVSSWEPYVSDIKIDVERIKTPVGADVIGPSIEAEIPLFDHHHDEYAIAISDLKIAKANMEQSAIEIQNNVHLNYKKTINAKIVVDEYMKNLMPLRAEIVKRAREHENYILQGIFDIYDTNYNEYQSYIEFSQIIRDYWIAFTDLRHAVGDSISYPSQQKIREISVKELFDN